ncbi:MULTISPECIES: chromophore lyase CpcT/CpeT [Prochlorococcus]|uniref:chromophore lyase CpcT/CpeT n=1 Tax=Prochlorococcus TaxID=1218 RepID=UPI0005337B02|nr:MULTISPECIES: chromophore lyase CpcT/CpeT [Prochlorococcus]KGG13053.1 CpeT-like [Prochlorococcus sp. MIT 0601]
MNLSRLDNFTRAFTGHFSNKEQAINSPKDFAHIDIYVRTLPIDLFNVPSFYSEQSFNYSPWSPYRQAVHKLYYENNTFLLKNFMLTNSKKVAGAGFQSDLLKYIEAGQIKIRNGCEMEFTELDKGHYIGKLKNCKKCIIQKDGKETYLISQVEINKHSWVSIDEGFDIDTNEKIWGSISGALKFVRLEENID